MLANLPPSLRDGLMGHDRDEDLIKTVLRTYFQFMKPFWVALATKRSYSETCHIKPRFMHSHPSLLTKVHWNVALVAAQKDATARGWDLVITYQYPTKKNNNRCLSKGFRNWEGPCSALAYVYCKISKCPMRLKSIYQVPTGADRAHCRWIGSYIPDEGLVNKLLNYEVSISQSYYLIFSLLREMDILLRFKEKKTTLESKVANRDVGAIISKVFSDHFCDLFHVACNASETKKDKRYLEYIISRV